MKKVIFGLLLLNSISGFAAGYERTVAIESMHTEDDGNIYSYSYWLDDKGNHLGMKSDSESSKPGTVGQIQYRLIPASTEVENKLTRNSTVTIKGSLLNKEQFKGGYTVHTVLVKDVITKD